MEIDRESHNDGPMDELFAKTVSPVENPPKLCHCLLESIEIILEKMGHKVPENKTMTWQSKTQKESH